MKIKNVLVTGEPLFLDRHQFLFKALSNHFDRLHFSPRQGEWYEAKLPRIALKGLLTLRTGSLSKANAVFQKNRIAFVLKSQRAEREIQKLDEQPDLVFQMFGTYRPFWKTDNILYVIFLDYTTALAELNWPIGTTFLSDRARQKWFECERLTYATATHIFSMSQIVKTSLIQDYEIAAQKITVVGSSGDFQEPYGGEKTLGSQQILFNGSDFERKGGDLVLAAFRKVRQIVPNAKLIVVGKTISQRLGFCAGRGFANANESDETGIVNLGYIKSRSEIHQLFLESDLVVAPAYCDPFPTFLMEAMNYGVPCITSNRDGMPEIVEHGVSGVVMNQLTSDRLADEIVELLSNSTKLASMSQASRRRIQTQLNWNHIASQIICKLVEKFS